MKIWIQCSSFKHLLQREKINSRFKLCSKITSFTIREVCCLRVYEELRVCLVTFRIVLTIAPKLYRAAKTFFIFHRVLCFLGSFLAFQQVLCWLTDLETSWKAFATEDKDRSVLNSELSEKDLLKWSWRPFYISEIPVCWKCSNISWSLAHFQGLIPISLFVTFWISSTELWS